MSADGRFAASVLDPPPANAGSVEAVLIWDLDRDCEATRWTLPPGPKIRRVAFAPDGRSIMVTRDLGSIERWDVTADPSNFVHSPQPTMVGRHSPSYLPYALEFSTDGRQLASCGVWVARPSFSMEYLRVLRTLFSNRRNYEPPMEIIVLDSTNGRQIGCLRDEAIPVFSPDGRSLATTSTSGPVGTTIIRDLPRRR